VTVDERDYLADRFEAHRAHLQAVAYRMLGSVNEADDAVQESWLRLSRSDAGSVETCADGSRRSSHGFASTCCARASRAARSR
jgi:DNA-directed RNA polymerase specialized sigma24 family protein